METVRGKVAWEGKDFVNKKGKVMRFLRLETGVEVGACIAEPSLMGQTVLFLGMQAPDRKFFASDYAVVQTSVLDFLKFAVKGLGPKRLTFARSHFGGDEGLEAVLTDSPERLAEIPGITAAKAQLIGEAFQANRGIRPLLDYLTPHGVSLNHIRRIYAHFQSHAIEKIARDPYSMCQIPGIGFATADRAAMSMGMDPKSPLRIYHAVSAAASQLSEGEGCTALDRDRLTLETAKLLKTAGPTFTGLVDAAITKLLADGRLVDLGEGMIATRSAYRTETEILQRIQTLVSAVRPRIPHYQDVIRLSEAALGFPLTPAQLKPVELVAAGAAVVMVCGYAGAGKTTSARVLLDVLSSAYGRDQVACIALSGKAADRIREATGYPAGTIHSVLGFRPGADGSWSYDKTNPLPKKVVLLDEASMVNAQLFLRVLDALPDDGILLILGDGAQLSAIGAGQPFADLLHSGLVPTVILTEILRQGEGALTVAADAVRHGEVPDLGGGNDLTFVFRGADDTTGEILKAARAAVAAGIDPIHGFQVIAPMYAGDLGIDTLNALLQPVLNPYRGEEVLVHEEGRFCPGDKVLHCRNQDMMAVALGVYEGKGFVLDAAEKTRIMNGSVGRVIAVDTALKLIFVQFGQLIAKYQENDLGELLAHGFAISGHKSQGSEYLRTIVVINSEAKRMLTSTWVYTAMTRASSYCAVIGDREAFVAGCRNIIATTRETVLQHLVRDLQLKEAA